MNEIVSGGMKLFRGWNCLGTRKTVLGRMKLSQNEWHCLEASKTVWKRIKLSQNEFNFLFYLLSHLPHLVFFRYYLSFCSSPSSLIPKSFRLSCFIPFLPHYMFLFSAPPIIPSSLNSISSIHSIFSLLIFLSLIPLSSFSLSPSVLSTKYYMQWALQVRPASWQSFVVCTRR